MKKILIIDDSVTLRIHIRKCLEGEDFDFVEAEDGAAGIELLMESSDFDLIILDMNMPNCNGYEMLVTLKESNTATEIPKMILTTETGKKTRQLVEELNCSVVAWMNKPIRAESFKKSINKIFKFIEKKKGQG